jgi:hypothetical protein
VTGFQKKAQKNNLKRPASVIFFVRIEIHLGGLSQNKSVHNEDMFEIKRKRKKHAA